MLEINAPDLKQVAKAVSGKLRGTNVIFSGVTIDSRSLVSGNLFVAIRGSNFDGHEFLVQVKEAGAVAAIVDEFMDTDLPQIKVANTQKALTSLAKVWREAVAIPVIGITGSNGKTTVKEMVAAILSQKSVGLKTAGNFNNEIGVPLTLLKLTSDHQWAVIEMGASHADEIEVLAKLAQPTIGLVNNISMAHIEGFGTLEETAKTKGALFSCLGDGVAIMPEGSPYTAIWQEQSSTENYLSFGDNSKADVWFEEKEGNTLIIFSALGAVEVTLALAGKHNFYNACASTAIAMAYGTDLQAIKQGLESMEQVKGRLEEKTHASGFKIVDDSYNASPSSVKVALDYLVSQSQHTVFVLGDMGELGGETKKAHQEVGLYAQEAGVSMVYTLGKFSKYAGDSFEGVSRHFEKQADLLAALRSILHEKSTVLIKGSRFMQMNKVVQALLEDIMIGDIE